MPFMGMPMGVWPPGGMPPQYAPFMARAMMANPFMHLMGQGPQGPKKEKKDKKEKKGKKEDKDGKDGMGEKDEMGTMERKEKSRGLHRRGHKEMADRSDSLHP